MLLRLCLCFFVYHAYSASIGGREDFQDTQHEEQYQRNELYKKLTPIIHMPLLFSANEALSGFKDKTEHTLHISAKAEHHLLRCLLMKIRDIVPESVITNKKACVCTTLESSAALSGVLEECGFRAQVGLTAGCLDYRKTSDLRFNNDFSQIFAANTDKSMFVFVQVVDQFWLNMADFLHQLDNNATIRTRAQVKQDISVLLCVCVQPHNTSDLDLILDKSMASHLALRIIHARRLAQEQPFDEFFMTSTEAQQQHQQWLQSLQKYDLKFMTVQTNKQSRIFTTQDAENLFILNHPPVAQKTLSRVSSSCKKKNPTIDVLIDVPKPTFFSAEMPSAEKSCIFSCSIRLFKSLREKSDEVFYAPAPNEFMRYGKGDNALLAPKTRVLLCAGPPNYEEKMLALAQDFAQTCTRNYSKILFIPCDSWRPDRSRYKHTDAFQGSLTQLTHTDPSVTQINSVSPLRKPVGRRLSIRKPVSRSLSTRKPLSRRLSIKTAGKAPEKQSIIDHPDSMQ